MHNEGACGAHRDGLQVLEVVVDNLRQREAVQLQRVSR